MDENEVYDLTEDIEEQANDEVVIEEPLVIRADELSKIINNATINEIKRLENRLEKHKDCRLLLGMLLVYGGCKEELKEVEEARTSLRNLIEIQEGVPFSFKKNYVKMRCKITKKSAIRIHTQEPSKMIVSQEIPDEEKEVLIYESELNETEHNKVLACAEKGSVYNITIVGAIIETLNISGIVQNVERKNVAPEEEFQIQTELVELNCKVKGIAALNIVTNEPTDIEVFVNNGENSIYSTKNPICEHNTVLDFKSIYNGENNYGVCIISKYITNIKGAIVQYNDSRYVEKSLGGIWLRRKESAIPHYLSVERLHEFTSQVLVPDSIWFIKESEIGLVLNRITEVSMEIKKNMEDKWWNSNLAEAISSIVNMAWTVLGAFTVPGVSISVGMVLFFLSSMDLNASMEERIAFLDKCWLQIRNSVLDAGENGFKGDIKLTIFRKYYLGAEHCGRGSVPVVKYEPDCKVEEWIGDKMDVPSGYIGDWYFKKTVSENESHDFFADYLYQKL